MDLKEMGPGDVYWIGTIQSRANGCWRLLFSRFRFFSRYL